MTCYFAGTYSELTFNDKIIKVDTYLSHIVTKIYGYYKGINFFRAHYYTTTNTNQIPLVSLPRLIIHRV